MQDVAGKPKIKNCDPRSGMSFGPVGFTRGERVSITRSKKDRRESATISRRAFLKSTGLAVAGATAVETGLTTLRVSAATVTTTTRAAIVGPSAVGIALNVNGIEHLVSVKPSMTLVDVLRDALRLMGTNIGCDRGSCSACTVWLDRVPVASCMLLAIDVGGRKITTIEGLATEEALHPCRQHLWHTMQCNAVFTRRGSS